MRERRYGLPEFRQDLINIFGVTVENNTVLMPLLNGAFNAWAYHLTAGSDTLIFVEPHRWVRNVIEVICSFKNRAVKIESHSICAWESYNGKHFFTNGIRLYAKDDATLEELLTHFRAFLEINSVDALKDWARCILPAWSEAFIQRMPQEVQGFYFPKVAA